MSLPLLHRSLRPWPVLRLAAADLRDEWLLSFCISLATAAVLAPLMILFGLKSGAIDIMRSRLIQDPRNREVRPKITRTYPEAWFEQSRKRPDVSFVIPLTRGVSSTVEAKNPTNAATARLDLSPTGAGDALVTENGGRSPRPNECVLTSSAADALSVNPGEEIEIRTSRRVDGEFQTAALKLRVAAVLDMRAGGSDIAYVPLSVLEAVEQYLDGQAVPEYGWPGTRPFAHAEHDGALLSGRAETMDPALERRLVTDTGFVRLQPLAPEEVKSLCGFTPEDGMAYWLLRPAGSTVRAENFEALADKLRGIEMRVTPWVDDVPVVLRLADGRQFARKLKSVPAADAHGTSVGSDGRFALHVLDGQLASGTACSVASRGASPELVLPAIATPGTPADGFLLVPPEEAGLMRLASSRRLVVDEKTGRLVLTRRSYSGFRMYAASIDQVDGLRRSLEAEGIPVFHEAERINQVVLIDQQLTRFFWFIAATGIAGAIATLAASLYASAERKSYELAVLRLLGFTRFEILQFPAWQALILAACGFGLALIVYAAASLVLQQVFQEHLRAGESLMSLPARPVFAIFCAIVGLSLLSSLLASMRILRSDLSEALREGGS